MEEWNRKGLPVDIRAGVENEESRFGATEAERKTT
jgi:hypothetical protein